MEAIHNVVLNAVVKIVLNLVVQVVLNPIGDGIWRWIVHVAAELIVRVIPVRIRSKTWMPAQLRLAERGWPAHICISKMLDVAVELLHVPLNSRRGNVRMNGRCRIDVDSGTSQVASN